MRARMLTLLLLASLLGGCAGLEPLLCWPACHQRERSAHGSSSLVGFLYPEGTDALPPDDLPTLPVPMRVGLAFLPERSSQPVDGLEAARRDAILQRIADRFRSRPFIREIVIVPDYYLRDVKGFEGLAGVQRLHGVDLMALVSYDQVGHEDDRKSAVAYLTILGSYLVRGTRQEETTLLDMAVVDAASRSIVLRAGGTDTRVHNTTYVGSEVEARKLATASFDAAADQLIERFDVALEQLQADIRSGKSGVKVRPARGGGGVGALGTGTALALLGFAGLAARRRVAARLR